ncbi:MAG TPA: DUF3263 domain-containing protein [Actinomycetota bacterium]
MSAPPPEAALELDPRLRDILDFERAWWKHPGPKERAVRERFGLSPARYHQLLNRAVDLPEALAYDPMLVRRLRRLRETRRRKRFARQLGFEL